VLNAITGTLTVDSNLTNSEVLSLARKLGSLGRQRRNLRDRAYSTVNGKLVLNPAVTDQLWTATEKNSIAKFASVFPATLTPKLLL
jgi:hypothetical protein